VSYSFVRSCGLESEPLDVILAVATLVGKKIVCTLVVRSCLVLFNGHIMSTNLIMFEMSGFDVILVMDWLSMYHTYVD
jgi:hypothetical protein